MKTNELCQTELLETELADHLIVYKQISDWIVRDI